MKLDEVVFLHPVKIRGNMAVSLNTTVSVGRLGAASPVGLEIDDMARLLHVTDKSTGKTLRVVPMTNVSDFMPTAEEAKAKK